MNELTTARGEITCLKDRLGAHEARHKLVKLTQDFRLNPKDYVDIVSRFRLMITQRDAELKAKDGELKANNEEIEQLIG